jgi:hypothetical protein
VPRLDPSRLDAQHQCWPPGRCIAYHRWRNSTLRCASYILIHGDIGSQDACSVQRAGEHKSWRDKRAGARVRGSVTGIRLLFNESREANLQSGCAIDRRHFAAQSANVIGLRHQAGCECKGNSRVSANPFWGSFLSPWVSSDKVERGSLLQPERLVNRGVRVAHPLKRPTGGAGPGAGYRTQPARLAQFEKLANAVWHYNFCP